MEPGPRVNGLGPTAGRIVVDGRRAGVATGRAGGGRTRAGDGRSSQGIDGKSKEVLEVVSRRFDLEATERAESARIRAIGPANIRDDPEPELSVLCRLFLSSTPPALNLRLSVVVFVSRSGGSTSVPVL